MFMTSVSATDCGALKLISNPLAKEKLSQTTLQKYANIIVKQQATPNYLALRRHLTVRVEHLAAL